MTTTRFLIGAAVLAGQALVQTQQRPTFVERTTGVRLDVSVFDGSAVVHGLGAGSFEVFDNGARQQFSVIETRDAPFDVVLVVQPLPSLTRDRRYFVQQGLEPFRTLLRDDDRLAMVMASAGPDVLRPLLPVSRDFAIAPILAGHDGVAVRDALVRAFLLFDDADRRRAVIAFTDCQHDQSWVTAAGVEAAARHQPAELVLAALDSTQFVVTGNMVVGPEGVASNTKWARFRDAAVLQVPAYLGRLTKQSGGRVIDLRFGDAADRLTEFLTNLRSQYAITYTPASSRPGWHDIRVTLTGRRGVVVTRNGYWRE